ncbi:endonuclease NucS domain-containing protein [Gloeocapsopsis sp. IPPAS B-1203]|uniref:endonuclease NucS domain-containing protein n=1 Tax=Gloeocapsopsis sp. IPPAS B-1203 TaxID=2049454 RepID=UPI000C18F176|nr:endonuclease NucS domain-containing protein [Gloeocapsopsis sp. IPPAS B-1203]PIG94165.1 hypothetical protein CSQ79_07505 [Gloeocapsopsis sp. IPPAS B-1203]
MPYLKAKKLTANLKRFDKESNKANRKLIYIGGEVRFQSEIDLENYIESIFQKIFSDLVLIRRQYTIKAQRCDLLCCNKLSKQPVIIELKNEEDRNIVSQLTRYRKVVLLNKPFAEQIDYSLPVKLVAIAPTFHEDSYCDKESSKFENDFYFWEFSIEVHNNLGQFKLREQTYNIPYPIYGLPNSIPNSELRNHLPAFTSNFLGKLPRNYHDSFIALRTLLISQPKIKEMVSSSYNKLLYGTGEGESYKKLAEITNTSKGVFLFLWLPACVRTNIKIPVARFGFILLEGNSPLSRDSLIEWVVYTKSNFVLRDEINDDTRLSFNRHGMLKYCEPNLYLPQASDFSKNTFRLLVYLLKGIKPPIDEATLEWWKSYKTQNHNTLGWYIDLAIKTWNYRVK